MTILILGAADDAHAAHMQAWLAARGAETAILDSRSFPARTSITFDPLRSVGQLRLPDGRRLDWRSIHAVYWRGYEGAQSPPLPDAEQAWIAANDARSLFETFLIQLPARWVNSWQAWHLHQTKPVQLARVAALGVPVPATVVTNDAEQVLHFMALHRQCIFKPVQGGASTRRVTPGHLTADNLLSLNLAPITLQEEVPGTDVRVFVAGERVMACKIESECLDFRDDPHPRLTAMDLPPEVASWSLGIARALGLLWTGMDWRCTPDGRHVFLEANPSPMFLGFEKATGLPLTQSLGDLLLNQTASNRAPS